MNITELARILRVTPQELKDKLPLIGFDIGQKAIKIDNATAQRIIREWPFLIRRLEQQKIGETKNSQTLSQEHAVEKKIVIVPNFIIVKDFAVLAQLPISKVLAQLMKNGIFTSMNERIDADTAMIIGADLGLDVKLKEGEDETEAKEDEKLKKILSLEKEEDLIKRPPVIVVMGHVDHGKTKLLDAIRKTNVVAGEAGGITQHIGAYQVERKGKLITFIDTPGHEAFTAMRSRGAKVADIAILVVAADDGVKPQTVEAFRIIEAAKIPYVVAINKIDKPGADINKTKQELSTQLNITPEDWGGKVTCVPVSAKDGTGIEELLDMILLTADMEAGNMKANPNAPAVGTVVESNVNKGAGPVATILIQNGTLHLGDQLCFEGKIYGKVRAFKNYKGEIITAASPSTPIMVIGLKVAPRVGDILEVGEGEKVKFNKTKMGGKDMPTKQETEQEKAKIKKLKLIIKSDVFGSAEAIEESLEKISTELVGIDIIHKGLGNITEGDVIKAEASGAVVIGFNVKTPVQIENLIREKNVKAKTFNIIYDLIEYARKEMEALIEIEIKRIDMGRLKVLAIFRTEKNAQIVGGKVLDGKIEKNGLIEVTRDKNIIAMGKMTMLQYNKQEVSSVEENQECGIRYEGKPLIQVGDILQIYKEERIIKKL
ncbi:MAG: translation initiation factor IF-2 [Patescibacteria group bacterium]|nr:translation initiation factor IF-2 [Patescibacteria group bacterium]